MPDDMTAMLTQGLEAGLSPQDVLLSQMDISDPTTALLVKLFANRASASEARSESDSDKEQDEETKQRLERLSRALRQLRRTNDSLRSEIDDLRLRNDTLAAALGACYLCWGAYPACEVCNGEGKPGYFPIDKPVFTDLVLPAVRAFKTPSASSSAESRSHLN
jgi:hypothetical protein